MSREVNTALALQGPEECLKKIYDNLLEWAGTGCFEAMLSQVVTQGDALGETLTSGFCSTGMSGLVQNVTALSGEVIQTNSGEAGTSEKLQGTHCSGILSLTCDLSVSNLDDTDDILRMFEEAVADGQTSCRA